LRPNSHDREPKRKANAMCHPQIPVGMGAPDAQEREVIIDLPAGERLPSLHVGHDGRPAVLLVGDVFGRSPFYERLATIIAASGFQVLLPDFFFRQGPLPERTRQAAFARRARLDEARTIDDLRAAIEWLRAVGPDAKVGTIGFCMGGTFVLDLACLEDDLVTVAYYGFPVPQASLPSPPPRPIDLVDELRGPVLALWGEDDDTVGIDNVRSYIARAGAANPTFSAEVLPGLGHGFLADADLSGGDTGGASWQRALTHLAHHLALEAVR
jgi:carboxymethylenebutenolidase